jgi:hypothetical protein
VRYLVTGAVSYSAAHLSESADVPGFGALEFSRAAMP